MPPSPILSRLSTRLYIRFLRPIAYFTWVDLGYGALYSVNFFCLLHFLNEHVGSFPWTEGPSMLPTMAVKGDRVYVDKLYRRGRGIQVGDVVDFKHPLHPGEGAIKRVLGMPGDFVLRDTPEIEGEKGKGKGMMTQIPEGHFWVVGDNVEESRDSRYYGPLPLALIKGKVVAKVAPWRDRGWVVNTLQKPEEHV